MSKVAKKRDARPASRVSSFHRNVSANSSGRQMAGCREGDFSLQSSTARTLSPDSPHRTRGESPLPSINERLAYLRPSRELLEYYRKKIAEFDTEREDMGKKLDQYKQTYEEQHKIQWEIRQREDEISELQKALSDMQVYLFQEREHVLRLYAENDRLKLQELDDRKKIQTLLLISGLTENEVSYFVKEPPNMALIEQKFPKKLHNELANKSGKVVDARASTDASKRERVATAEHSCDGGGGDDKRQRRDSQTLALQVEALQAQLQEQTKLAREQADALTDDRRLKAEECETRHQRDAEKIQTLLEKLHRTQDLLYDSTQDYLDLRYQHRNREKRWMSEKDRLLRELDSSRRDPVGRSGSPLGVDCVPPNATLLNISAEESNASWIQKQEEIVSLTNQLEQSQRLADMYREQVIQLEDELAKIREQGEVGKELYKERSERLTKRLEIVNQRYQELEKRRCLEVEGFKADIKNLRGRLKDLEKQLYKVTMEMAEDFEDFQLPDDVDLQILRNVRKTAGRSKQIMGQLKTLKSKVYGLESDLRHL